MLSNLPNEIQALLIFPLLPFKLKSPLILLCPYHASSSKRYAPHPRQSPAPIIFLAKASQAFLTNFMASTLTTLEDKFLGIPVAIIR